MNSYWVQIAGGDAVCCDGNSAEHAEKIVEAIRDQRVVLVRRLPYPACPRIYAGSGIPEFCYTPEECAGFTSCPRGPSCVE